MVKLVIKYQITHIHLLDSNEISTDKITHVKLSNNLTCTTEELIEFLTGRFRYQFFYVYQNIILFKLYIEATSSPKSKPYIRTKGLHTSKDLLLSLPRF